MNTAQKKRTVVLISGRGSNLAAFIAAAGDAAYPAEIAGVISSRPDANGLEAAARHGIPTRVISRGDYGAPDEHDAALEDALGDFRADIVCLAGYMQLLSAGIVDAWHGRMLNIHPSLLPSFRGLDPHARALAAGIRIHGCTVHFVTHDVDAGPIIAQAAVPVQADDDESRLAARVLEAEHKLYPLALALVARGEARIENGRVAFEGAGGETSAALFSPAPAAAPEVNSDLEALARFTP